MLTRLNNLRTREDGFTLIELLIVVLIIGILAAVAIPVYIGIQNQAHKSSVQADTNIAVKKVQVGLTEGQTLASLLGTTTGSDKESITIAADADGKNFTVTSTEAKATANIDYSYSYSSKTGAFTEGVIPPTAGIVAGASVTTTGESNDPLLTDWSGYTGATIAPTTTRAYSGTKSFQLAATTTSWQKYANFFVDSSANPVVPGASYTMTAYVYVATTDTNDTSATAMTYNGGSSSSSSINQFNTWYKVTNTFTASSDGTLRASFWLYQSAADPNSTAFVDDVKFVKN